MINNFNGARVQYSEIPQIPPVTMGFSHSLRLGIKEFQQIPKRKERRGEHFDSKNPNLFQRGEDVVRCE
jgi:hypothetical protein